MRYSLLTIALMLLLLCPMLFAGGESERRFLSKYGLSEEQIDQIEQIYRQSLEDRSEAEERFLNIREEIGRLLVSNEPRLDEIRSKMREGLELEIELRMARIRSELEVRRLIGDKGWSEIIRLREHYRRRRWLPRRWGEDGGWLFHNSGLDVQATNCLQSDRLL